MKYHPEEISVSWEIGTGPLVSERQNWILDHGDGCAVYYNHPYVGIRFSSEENALLFFLRFSGNREENETSP